MSFANLFTVTVVAAMPLTPVLAQRTRETLAGREVAIYNVAGRVQIEPGSSSDVVVEITRGGRDADRVTVATGAIRGRNTLRMVYPTNEDIVYRGGRQNGWGDNSTVNLNSDGTWNNGARGWRGDRVKVKTSGSGTEAWADLVVRVPAGKSVALYGIVGDVDVTRVEADLSIDVGASRVTANDTRGRLKIDAGSGSVEVRNASGDDLTVDTGSGGVSLSDITSDHCDIDTGSGGVGGSGIECRTLKVDVGSGGVRLARVRANDIAVDAGSGSVDLSLRSSPRLAQIETGSGGVVLALPASIGAELDIDTGSGGISSEFPVKAQRMQRDELRGTIGDGSGRIRVSTGSGSVRLRRVVD